MRGLTLRYTGTLEVDELSDIPRAYALPTEAGTVITIGRATENDVFLYSTTLSEAVRTTVSRYHAQIHVGERGYSLVDLGSMNGSFVDGLRVERNAHAPLAAGSVIVLGGASSCCDVRLSAAAPLRLAHSCARAAPTLRLQAARASASESCLPITSHADGSS